MGTAPSPLGNSPKRLLRAGVRRNFRQKPLFCACGQRMPVIGGLCSKCYRMRRHSRDYFGGNRERVLERDRYRCASCGAGNAKLHVHHRQPGVSEPGLLITVCSGCHARLHHLASIHVWIPELFVVLWAEQHPDSPVQLQLAFGADV